MLNIWHNFYRKIFKPKIKITGKCLCCGKCCKNIILTYKKQPVTDKKQFNSLKAKKSFYKRFSPIYKDHKNQIIYFNCSFLKDNKCSDHKNRPTICREYPSTLMFSKGGKLLSECGYKITPKTSFADYLNN